MTHDFFFAFHKDWTQITEQITSTLADVSNIQIEIAAKVTVRMKQKGDILAKLLNIHD